jgi:hypothetical protein
MSASMQGKELYRVAREAVPIIGVAANQEPKAAGERGCVASSPLFSGHLASDSSSAAAKQRIHSDRRHSPVSQ